MSKYYHITTPDAWKYIQKNGLKCDDEGNIFLLNTMFPAVVEFVAFGQLFGSQKDYVLIEVDGRGIDGPLDIDNVAEISAYLGHQWIVKQDSISIKHLKFMHKRTLTEESAKISYEQVMNKFKSVQEKYKRKRKRKNKQDGKN